MAGRHGEDKAEDDGEAGGGAGGSLRLDKWLWFARMAKTRSLAQTLIEDGAVRLNREKVTKPAHAVKPGDLLTIMQGPRLRLLKVVALGTRRGPAPEAQVLYDDLAPLPPPGQAKPEPEAPQTAQREAGAGRPTKRERRQTDRLRDG